MYSVQHVIYSYIENAKKIEMEDQLQMGTLLNYAIKFKGFFLFRLF